MRKDVKKALGIMTSCLIVVALTVTLIVQLIINSSGNERYFSGDAQIYYQSLLDAGFPEDYAVSLTELHLLHPTWNFVPLKITDTNAQYTWDHVIDKETEDGETNVIYSSDTYKAYHHPFNRELYDSGYYQASEKAVEYFMDPRNFLNETDIFQFYTLSGGADIPIDAVEAVLAGTFMENVTLENGMTYAEYFVAIGAELNVNPIFLAAKVRQEQGTRGTSPIISGACGTKLLDFYVNHTQTNADGDQVLAPSNGYTADELLAMNGYFNYFNVGATGTGLFKIYYNAMKYAKNGTAEKADDWGGNAAWNTRWKALYGGAYFLKTRYIDCYQSTVYLQKFNVDGRGSSNFKKQYMTSVFGSLAEGRSLYQSFAALDALDSPATFLIPVYKDMPSKPCADPADGACSYTAQATTKYSYQSEMTEPQRYSTKDKALYLDHETYPQKELSLSGIVTHSYRLEALEYAWDGGDWQTASQEKNVDLSIPIHFSENTSHILVVRGKASYDVTKKNETQTIHTYFLYAVIYVDVIPPPSVKLSLEVGNTVTDKTVYAGTHITLPTCDATDFVGWCGSDGSFLPSGAEMTVPEDDISFSAVFLNLKALEGASLSLKSDAPQLQFSAVIEKKSYERLTKNSDQILTITADLKKDGHTETTLTPKLTPITHSDGSEWLCLLVTTPDLPQSRLEDAYSAVFFAELRYTDGTQRTLTLSDASQARSAVQVATYALNDVNAGYSELLLSRLRSVVGNS